MMICLCCIVCCIYSYSATFQTAFSGVPVCPCVFCVCPDIEFKQGDKEHVVEVEVLFDGVREMREAFTLHLKPDENMVAETQVRNVVFTPNHHKTITQNPNRQLWNFSLRKMLKR